MILAERILADHDRVRIHDPAQAMVEPGHGADGTRAVARRLRRPACPQRLRSGGERALPDRHVRRARGQRRRQRLQQRQTGTAQGQVGGEAAHRIARIERVLADLHDPGAGGQSMGIRIPGHVGFPDQHQVRLGEQRAGVAALVHRMPARQGVIARIERYHRQREPFRQQRQSAVLARIAPERAGDNQRHPGACDPLRQPRHVARRLARARPGGRAEPAARRRGLPPPRPAPRAAG